MDGGEPDADFLVWNEVQGVYSMRRQWDSFGCPELGSGEIQMDGEK